MKNVRYFITSLLLFLNDNWIVAISQEEADEFYEKFHANDTLY